MYRLVESIRLLDGKFNNLSYHGQRMDKALKDLYSMEGGTDLESFFDSIQYPRKGLYKCRLLYDQHSKAVEFTLYTFTPVTSLKVLVDDDISYNHKFTDRLSIHQLMGKRGGCDDILIVKNGWITDSSYANLVFRRKDKWITPHTCLLKGTMRESLISTGVIEEEQIRVNDLSKFQKFKLINAMLGFESLVCDISNIFY